MKTNRMKFIDRKKSLILVIFFSLMFFIFGTYAWMDYSQHKSNEFTTAYDTDHYTASLVEDFDPHDGLDWEEGETVKKRLFVTNRGKLTDDFGNVYIRLQIKQFMQLTYGEATYSKETYMIDGSGSFIRTPDAEASVVISELNRLIKKNNIPILALTESQIGTRVKKVKGFYDQEPYYYIVSQAGDPNGGIGRHVILSMDSGSYGEPVVPGSVRARDEEITHHNQYGPNAISEECNYPLFKYDSLNDINKKYVEINFGDKVMTYDDYAAMSESSRTPTWILTNTDGHYIYWSEPLTPQDLELSKTSDLIESLTLKKHPDRYFEYFMHVDMQAVSYSDLAFWPELPEVLDQRWSTNSVLNSIQ